MDLHEKRLKLTPKRLEALDSLGIHTVEELLTYYPYRYETMNVKPFEEWQLKENITFEGEVVSRISTFHKGKLTISSFEVSAYDHVLRVTIYNRPWVHGLNMNQKITIQGIYNGANKVTAINYDEKPLAEHQQVTPLYSTKEGIPQKTIRACIEKVYEEVVNEIYDIVPEKLLRHYRLLRKAEALRRIHFPKSMDDVKTATRTLKYEEFLRFFTAIELMKNEEGRGTYKQPRIADRNKVNRLIQKLPYRLTPDQQKALNDILDDMGSTRPMYRLIQGDVGCGKTAVAALGLYGAVTAGYQAALLAPTEILARQHLLSLKNMIQDESVRIDVLYSGLAPKKKEEILARVKSGEIDILIGTHSIIQEDIVFHRLGMVVTDEQQRFGVEQRRALRDKGTQVDFLLMSATPIPRTLASALYGDMDISTIETMPPGRKTPITKYIEENSFRSVLDDVMRLLKSGHQLYVICAAVEENEEYDARNVKQMSVNLAKLFHGYHVGTLYGALPSEEKQKVMHAFADNQLQVLVSTTVVEVGMNVVNATGMIIYDADRFGLSQLHQLRGRIQRGDEQGQCWLLSDSKDPAVKERLNVLVKSNNGFEIAAEDLRLRGPGDILGKRQSGLPGFILGNLVEDTNMMNAARRDAGEIVRHADQPENQAMLGYIEEKNRQNEQYVD